MKLKSLTLTGFKSFADKTVFDFTDGMTAIVGPNGCGKSNIVDAVRWVLGEQSARTLRGGEMLDVIFNGTSQRRSSGYAEVGLTFDDAGGIVNADGQDMAPDHVVTIARRLYRSGESEYLVNNQPSRLKDIREMFLDTGAGTDAYSVIGQGKVETFLQANTEDRRALFDEAAGISRYKARRREAERRLERVQQNLLRLTDVLAEVQKSLRSIKYQAGKARSYQQYTAELKDLRALHSLAEYHRLSQQRRQVQAQVGALTDALSTITSQVEKLQGSRAAVEGELVDLDAKGQTLATRLSEVSGQIVNCQQRGEMTLQRARELADSVAVDVQRCELIEARQDTNRGETQTARQAFDGLAAELDTLDQRDQATRAQHTAGSRALEQLRRRLEDEKNGTIDLLRRTAALHNEINSHAIRRENLSNQRQRLTVRARDLSGQLEELLARRADGQAKLTQIHQVLDQTQQRLGLSQQAAKQLDADAQALQTELSGTQQQQSALKGRQHTLQEMQSRLEGVGEGVRKVMGAVQDGKLPCIRGMLGDFLETDVAHAAVIEAALAGAEQRLVAATLHDAIAAAPDIQSLLGGNGQVEILPLDALTPAPAGDVTLPAGIVARAADWVRCDEAVAPAVAAILGRTLVVNSLADAARAAGALGDGWRFVTPAGELLESGVRIRLGSAGKPATGLVWRRSELAELTRNLDQLAARVGELQQKIEQVTNERAHVEQTIHLLRTAVYEAQTERVEHQTLVEQLDVQVQRLRKEEPLVSAEVEQLAGQIESTVSGEANAKERVAELETLRVQRDAEITRLNEEFVALATQQENLTAEMTAAQVALAQVRQKRSGLEETLRHLEQQGQALAGELNALRHQIDGARARRAECEQVAQQAAQEAQKLEGDKAVLLSEQRENEESRLSLRQRLEEISSELAVYARKQEHDAAEVNQLRIQLGEVEVRIETLIARTNEELALDLPAAYPTYQHDENRDWQLVQNQIVELRGKIERLGNVNLDAIAEQEELTKRDQFLTEQVADIQDSQRQLVDLIKRINAESRKRFEESFEAVRANFNELFRKLFGGGKADILLTNPEDLLESPIEVVARPPGKELRSITLLSGGEKTMTALALLFSFFKARPSPFCLLDEVDAALDEANIGRYVGLVREFLQTSQFIVISHSKKTIGMADQIYGITMQEPGVSTRISVRFEEAARLAEQPGAQAASA